MTAIIHIFFLKMIAGFRNMDFGFRILWIMNVLQNAVIRLYSFFSRKNKDVETRFIASCFTCVSCFLCQIKQDAINRVSTWVILDFEFQNSLIINKFRNPQSTIRNFLGFLVICLSMTNCNLSRYVTGRDQYLLAQHQIEVKKIVGSEKKSVLAVELETLLKQRPMGKYLSDGRRNTWLYFRKLENPDTSRFQKWFYKKAQLPVYLDDSLTRLSIKNMNYYLQNKGYLYPNITATKKRYKKMADVTYMVDPGNLYVIDSVQFVCEDTTIQLHLNDIADRSFLQRGKPLDAKLYEQEIGRIVSALQDFGYARFARNFILPLDSDTTVYGNTPTVVNGKRNVNVMLTVLSPSEKEKHIQYSIGEVTIYPNYHPINSPISKSVYDTTFAGKRFFSDGQNTRSIRLERLAEVIKIGQNDRYSLTAGRNAYKALDRLLLYKFIIVKPSTDKCDSSKINYDIQLTPHDKMSFDAGLEYSYSNIAGNINPNRHGIVFDLGFGHRNLFRGAENLVANVAVGVDFNFSYDARATIGLNIPKFLNLSRLWTFYNKIHLLNPDFYKHIQDAGTTQFTMGYSYSNRLNNFTLQTFDLNYKYGLKREGTAQKRYNIVPTGITLSRSDNINETFRQNVLSQNRFLEKSLGAKLATGFIFKEYRFEMEKPSNAFGEKWYFRSEVEQSGSEIWLANYAYNQFRDTFKIAGTPYAKYVRLEGEGRYTRNFGGKNEIAIRGVLGIAIPFSDTKRDGIPFLKQFYVGGPNSIRAWRIRGIGPGNTLGDTTKSAQYQTGDIKLEANVEWRFPLFWRLESALFVDMGNVWRIKTESVTLPTTSGYFSSDFYKNIAIGSGVALRFDFSYVLLRIDVGYRLRYPYLLENKTTYWDFNNIGRLSKWNWNFGLGLPF
jgi:outer membrane protein insertion porin family